MNEWALIKQLAPLIHRPPYWTVQCICKHFFNYSSFPYYSKTYPHNSPVTLRIYLIIQILPFPPLGLEDQLFLDRLEDLFCLLHQVGL